MTNTQTLPADLRETGLFCCWRYEERDGRLTKIPVNPRTGGNAQSDNPATFAPLAVAEAAQGNYDGMGVGIFESLAAIDIDHCLTGNVWSDLAIDVYEIMGGCYTETSPSGEGLRLLFSVSPGFQYDTGRYYINNQKAGLEVYVAGVTKKYVTVTGNALNDCNRLLPRDSQLLQVLEKYMVRPQQERGALPWDGVIGGGQPLDLSDRELLEKARSAKNGAAFSRLWAGDTSAYRSDDSAADMALCNQLAFWTGRDPQRMDRLFRQSGLMRDKWDRRQSGTTYGRITIEKACQSCREVYSPRETAQQAFQPVGNPQPVADLRPPETQPGSTPALCVVSARELQDKQLPPVEWVVKGMLPVGFNLLASPPKYGKSWWVLDLGLSVAVGLLFLGRQTVQGRCLYLALEDNENRLKSRMNKLLVGEDAPAAFDFATKAADLDHGLLEQLEGYVAQHPDTRLIIIDTLQKVRGVSGKTEGAYQADYREAGRLKAFADQHRLCILCVHHLRKMADDSDPFNRISGTNGLMGAADTAIVMTRNKRNDANTVLSVTGRDVEPSDEIIMFDRESCKWELVGSVDRLEQQSARMEYDQEPMVQAVKKLVEKYPEGWAGTAVELMEESISLVGYYPETSVKSYTPALKRLKPQLYNYDRIIVDTKRRVHNTVRLRIYRAGIEFSASQEQLPQAEEG